MVESKSTKVKNYFNLHFKILLYFGIPIEGLNMRFKWLYIIYAFFMHALVNTSYPVVEFLGIVIDFNVDKFSFIVTYFISHFLAFCKICLLFVFRNDINKFCKMLETGRFAPDPQRGGNLENEYIKEAIVTSNRQSFFFHSFVLLIVCPRAIYGIMTPGKYAQFYDETIGENFTVYIPTKPFITYLPFDTNGSPLHEIVFAYQVLSCIFSGFIIGAADAIIYGFMCHIKAQFLILIHSLETFVDRTERLMNQNGIEISLQKYNKPKTLPNGIVIIEKLPEEALEYADICITESIKHHQEILNLSAGCEDIFCWLLLVQFGGSCLLICMQLYQLSLYDIMSISFFTMIAYLILMSVQVLLFCMHANDVKLISDRISNVAFHSNWIITSIKTQRSIMLMIHRSIKPIQLTAGKFIFLSLESFMSLMKGSASYFMFLKEMNKEP